MKEFAQYIRDIIGQVIKKVFHMDIVLARHPESDYIPMLQVVQICCQSRNYLKP